MLERILLVEDDDGHAELVTRQLRQTLAHEVEVVRAKGLMEALSFIERDEPDAVILDLGLPDTDREETLALFVASAPQLPLVVLTAESDDVLGAAAVGSGADDFIVKSEMSGGQLVRALRYAVERKRSSLAMLRYAEELEESNESLRRFSHLLAHELKQPLNPILLNCAVLRREFRDPSELALESISDIESAVRDMGRLVGDMLTFAKVSSVRTPEHEIEVQDIVLDVVDKLGPEILQRSAKVVIGELPTARVHETLARQLFHNLIGNALKYGRPEGARIEVSCRDEGDAYHFEVEDDGVGIPAEDHARAFEMFQRLGDREEEGSGIGLALCRLIVEHHGGTIGLGTDANRGCVVWFRLPKPGGNATDGQLLASPAAS